MRQSGWSSGSGSSNSMSMASGSGAIETLEPKAGSPGASPAPSSFIVNRGCWNLIASLLKIDYKSIISNGTRNVGCWYTITIVTSER